MLFLFYLLFLLLLLWSLPKAIHIHLCCTLWSILSKNKWPTALSLTTKVTDILTIHMCVCVCSCLILEPDCDSNANAVGRAANILTFGLNTYIHTCKAAMPNLKPRLHTAKGRAVYRLSLHKKLCLSSHTCAQKELLCSKFCTFSMQGIKSHTHTHTRHNNVHTHTHKAHTLATHTHRATPNHTHTYTHTPIHPQTHTLTHTHINSHTFNRSCSCSRYVG